MADSTTTQNAQEKNPKTNDKARTATSNFVTDLEAIRKRAREHIKDGAVTAGYKADRVKVIELLNDSLATEIVCTLRYRRHYYMATGLASESVAAEFLEHANEEQEHADRLAIRITQLGGEPNLNPESLTGRSHSDYVEGKDLVDMIREDLIAERIAIETYNEIIRFIGTDDPTTRRLFEDILAKEEEHADDMSDLLKKHDK
jgi:bacterioferritin